MKFNKTIRAISAHPLTRHDKLRSYLRVLRWQITARLAQGSVLMPFVNDARLVVRKGMKGATGNVYFGLHEFEDMAFVLHLLRPAELFVDVGANVGTYTVLAGKAAGARCVAFEPGDSAFSGLLDNVHVNRIHDRVEAVQCSIGAEDGLTKFLADRDATNRIATTDDEASGREIVSVPIRRLDHALGNRHPTLIKIDVEGYETQVINGAGRVLEDPSLLAVIMEANEAGKRYGCDESALQQRMSKLGFAQAAYEPFHRSLSLDSDGQVKRNTLLVRRDALDEVRDRLRSASAYRVLGRAI